METEQTSLETIFNGTDAPTEAPAEVVAEETVETTTEVVEAVEPVEAITEAETVTGEPEKGDKETVETPSTEVETQPEPAKTVPFEALMDERRKRQEFENRLARIEQERNAVPAPDPIEDPEAFTAHQDNKRLAERIQDRIAMSEQLVRTQVGNEEYDKAEGAFADEVQRNPALAVELRGHPNPAKYAYDIGKAALDRQEIGNPREFAAKQVAEALAKQKLEMADVVAKQVQEQLAKLMPKSLADNISQGGSSTQTPVFDGPTPLGDILPE